MLFYSSSFFFFFDVRNAEETVLPWPVGSKTLKCHQLTRPYLILSLRINFLPGSLLAVLFSKDGINVLEQPLFSVRLQEVGDY